MKERFLPISSLLIAVLATISVSGFTAKKKLSVTGTWRIAEVQVVKPDHTYTSVFPTESLVIITKTHYSICWTSHHTDTRGWQLPDSVKLARSNQSIVNTGTCELKDSILTTRADFALNPMFVNGVAKFKCSYAGDTLILTGLSVHSSDNIPHPVYAGGSHIVNKLVKLN